MTGRWQHRNGPVEPPLRLSQLHYDADGRLEYPRQHDRAPESDLARYLDEAHELMHTLSGRDLAEQTALVSADFEHLRWFDLPAVCLEP